MVADSVGSDMCHYLWVVRVVLDFLTVNITKKGSKKNITFSNIFFIIGVLWGQAEFTKAHPVKIGQVWQPG